MRLAMDAMDRHGSQWAASEAIAKKLGCSAQALHKWVAQAERDDGTRPGLKPEEKQRLKQLVREVKELRRANEILRKASAHFSQAELGRKQK